jgi:hypothetical protein
MGAQESDQHTQLSLSSRRHRAGFFACGGAKYRGQIRKVPLCGCGSRLIFRAVPRFSGACAHVGGGTQRLRAVRPWPISLEPATPRSPVWRTHMPWRGTSPIRVGISLRRGRPDRRRSRTAVLGRTPRTPAPGAPRHSRKVVAVIGGREEDTRRSHGRTPRTHAPGAPCHSRKVVAVIAGREEDTRRSHGRTPPSPPGGMGSRYNLPDWPMRRRPLFEDYVGYPRKCLRETPADKEATTIPAPTRTEAHRPTGALDAGGAFRDDAAGDGSPPIAASGVVPVGG